jgi:hypothetical protein
MYKRFMTGSRARLNLIHITLLEGEYKLIQIK